MNSEHHWRDRIFLKDLMFDNFKAESWSTTKDENDLERAEESFEIERLEVAEEIACKFVHDWIDSYYADHGFDYGLLSFSLSKIGDDGLDTVYYESEISRNDKPYQTLQIGLFDPWFLSKWQIFKIIGR